jgi:HEAT repeat protein
MSSTAGNPDSSREEEIVAGLQTNKLSIKRRRALVSELQRVGSERSVDVLRQSLRSSDNQLSVRAVFALAHIGTEKATEALIESLSMDTTPRFTFAVDSLGKMGARNAIPALIHCLESRGDQLQWGDKRVIILALTRMPHRSMVPVLSSALRDQRRAVRKAAAWALTEIRAPESTAALEEAAGSLSWPRNLQAKRALRVRPRDASE